MCSLHMEAPSGRLTTTHVPPACSVCFSRRDDGAALLATFQNGLVEQGPTRAPLRLPAAPYFRDLAEAAHEAARVSPSGAARAQRGLIPPDRVALLEEEQARCVRGVRCCVRECALLRFARGAARV
jgi:hypothetical protein